MKRILINATHAEEIRVALCNGNHLYDFDLENRTREQKKANIYKGHVTRVEPSLEAVFVEYGSQRQGFLPIREIANEYLAADPRSVTNIKQLIKEGDELIVQVEKEERGNKGAALSTMISLAGRYLVLMPNNARGGGISRQISGKVREEMKQSLSELNMPKGMSVIIRTAGIGKTTEDLQHDLDHLLNIWKGIQQQNQKYPSPRLVHQEAGVVTRAVRDYLRDDISEIWVDNEYAYNEAANFIEAVMPQQANKLRKYTDYEPMFARFGIEKQIETAYQREVRLPSGGSIVIDQTEALVSIDINSSKATKGADVSETAFNTNLEAADEIARQLRLRDMGGLIVIDFIDMATDEHQKQVENRLKEATKNDRARIQFAEISRFGLLEMSRQRLRPSLEEATGYLCPRCHGTGMIRDLRSLALSIMRQIEQKAIQERQGEIQAEVPTDIAAFLLNEKRDSLVYLEQESGTRITILPHAHLESPDFNITYNREGFAPSSYERIAESQQQENKDRGYDTSNWHTEENESIRVVSSNNSQNAWSNAENANNKLQNPQSGVKPNNVNEAATSTTSQPTLNQTTNTQSAVAWLSNLFAPTQQAQATHNISSQDAAAAIESIVNTGAKSLGIQGQVNAVVTNNVTTPIVTETVTTANNAQRTLNDNSASDNNEKETDRRKRSNRKSKSKKSTRYNNENSDVASSNDSEKNISENDEAANTHKSELPRREPNSRRESRGVKERRPALVNIESDISPQHADKEVSANTTSKKPEKSKATKPVNTNEVQVQVVKSHTKPQTVEPNTTHISLDNSKGERIENMVEDLSPSIQQAEAVTKSEALLTPVEAKTTALLSVSPSQGRAKNDPREVYKAYQISQKPVGTPVTALVQSLPKISGTVGQFIEQYLTDATTKLTESSVVACFLQAMDAYQQLTQPSASQQSVLETQVLEQSSFDQFFQNYGYAELSQQSLDNYHDAIQPANQFHTAAGKTEAIMNVVTKRASNDPRGQLSSEQEQDTPQTTNLQDTVKTSESTPSNELTSSTVVITGVNPYTQGSVGAWIIEIMGEEGQQLIQQGQLVTAYLKASQVAHASKALSQSVSNSPKQAETTEAVVAATATNLVSSHQDEFGSQEEDDSAETTNKAKTSPVSYKNMIESVAEQMKPTTIGMLTLATPKAPKTRTRKAKTTDKPAVKPKARTSKKVENAVVVTKKAKAETSVDEAISTQVLTADSNVIDDNM